MNFERENQVTETKTTERIKPIIILETGMMTEEDMNRLRENGLCVVESATPDTVRFIEPPAPGYDRMEKAAIQLFRRCMSRDSGWTISRTEMAEMWSVILMEGTPMQRPESPTEPRRTKRK